MLLLTSNFYIYSQVLLDYSHDAQLRCALIQERQPSPFLGSLQTKGPPPNTKNLTKTQASQATGQAYTLLFGVFLLSFREGNSSSPRALEALVERWGVVVLRSLRFRSGPGAAINAPRVSLYIEIQPPNIQVQQFVTNHCVLTENPSFQHHTILVWSPEYCDDGMPRRG